MAFNGSGVFQRLYSWTNDALAGIKIRADRMDNEMNGMATGLSTCITKDGQTTITANLPMAGFKHTAVAVGTVLTDYTRYDQVAVGKTNWAVAGGAADALTAIYTVPTAAPVDGQLFFIRATAVNTTTTPTFAPDGQTARTIVALGGQALVAGDITVDSELILRYNLANTRYEWANKPAGVTTDGTQTLTNKTLVSPKINQILDVNGNEILIMTPIASAVNELTILNAITATNPSITASGGDTNIGIDLLPKGTGAVNIKATAVQGASVALFEATGNGVNNVKIKAPDALTADYILTLANGLPATTQNLQVSSTGQLSYSAGSGLVQHIAATPYTSASAITGNIPMDDTVPQSAEGTQILTASITPLASGNKILISASGNICAAGAGAVTVAVFRGTTCIIAKAVYSAGPVAPVSWGFEFEDSPATTSATTYSIRVGAPSGNVVCNGDVSSGRFLGGSQACTMELLELS